RSIALLFERLLGVGLRREGKAAAPGRLEVVVDGRLQGAQPLVRPRAGEDDMGVLTGSSENVLLNDRTDLLVRLPRLPQSIAFVRDENAPPVPGPNVLDEHRVIVRGELPVEDAQERDVVADVEPRDVRIRRKLARAVPW